MARAGEVSWPAKPDIRSVLDLHREMNPPGTGPLLVGLDRTTGQLFFLSRTGLCVTRDRAVRESVCRKVYDAWPQLRVSG